MIKNDESNSLIDWNTPVAQCPNIPLIPLPVFSNQVQFSEDNPFDAVERQINENELFFNVLDADSYFRDGKTESQNILNENLTNDIVQLIDNVNLYENKIDTDDDPNYVYCEKMKNESEKSLRENSADSILSNISDIKEMVMNRISNCINKTLYQNSLSTSSHSSSASNKSRNLLNNCFIVSDEPKGSYVEVSEELCDNVEDIQSIIPEWDELLSSSDDDRPIEKTIFTPKTKKIHSSTLDKKLPVTQKEKKEVRVPFSYEDCDIRIRKNNSVVKQRPMKATTPLSKMKKLANKNTAKINDNCKTSTLENSKITSSSTLFKYKKRSFPVATSTPQKTKSISNSSTEKLLSKTKYSPTDYSRPSSPDSTSSSRRSLINVTNKFATKIKRLNSNPVSSSTNVTFPRITIKTSKYPRNTSITEIVRKIPVKN